MTKLIGNGSENNPFTSIDGRAGINDLLSSLSSRGGAVTLKCGRYDISEPIIFDTPSSRLSGEVWSCNTDPNGVFESPYGTKLRLVKTNGTILKVGKNTDPISGAIISNLGFQGNIDGMDTRPSFSKETPSENAGITLSSVRTDQCEFSRLSFCGLGVGVCAIGNSEIDACSFEKMNLDGCAVGIYFAPRASYYAKIKNCVIADNPYYGIYAKGNDTFHNLEISSCTLVRNGGAFIDNDLTPSAIFFDGLNNSCVTNCLFDAPGTFWYYPKNSTKNEERQPSHRKTVALTIKGNGNRITNNTFLNSSSSSIEVTGNNNILLSNICDGDIVIEGENNTVCSLVFTSPTARLILKGKAKTSTTILAVDENRIIKQ